MRKGVKKLKLTKETLALLEERDIQQIRGGTTTNCWDSDEFVPFPSACPRGC